MKLSATFALLSLSLGLGGCASLMPPSAADLEKIPLIRFGNAAPADGEFVLHYPKGAPLPVQASIAGDLVAEKAVATLHAAPSRDIYQYKQWVSFDGKNWQNGMDTVGVSIRIEMPGVKDGKTPGALETTFDLKK